MNQEPNNSRRNPEPKPAGVNLTLYVLIIGAAVLFVFFYFLQATDEEIAYTDLLKLIAGEPVHATVNNTQVTYHSVNEIRVGKTDVSGQVRRYDGPPEKLKERQDSGTAGQLVNFRTYKTDNAEEELLLIQALESGRSDGQGPRIPLGFPERA